MVSVPELPASIPRSVRHFSRIGTASERLFCHSSLEELEVRLNPVGLWDAVRVATVWRRTRTSRQSLSLLLHSLEAADEVRDVPCWHDGWVLLRVPLELLSALLSHRTSQHSVSASEGLSSWSPGTAKDMLMLMINEGIPHKGNYFGSYKWKICVYFAFNKV